MKLFKLYIVSLMCLLNIPHVLSECYYSRFNIPVPTEVPCGCSPISLSCESYCTRNPLTQIGVCTCPYFYDAPIVTGNAYSESLGRMFTYDDKKESVLNPATQDIYFSTDDYCPKCGHSAPIHNYPNKFSALERAKKSER
jgi:hypothetical protein